MMSKCQDTFLYGVNVYRNNLSLESLFPEFRRPIDRGNVPRHEFTARCLPASNYSFTLSTFFKLHCDLAHVFVKQEMIDRLFSVGISFQTAVRKRQDKYVKEKFCKHPHAKQKMSNHYAQCTPDITGLLGSYGQIFCADYYEKVGLPAHMAVDREVRHPTFGFFYNKEYSIALFMRAIGNTGAYSVQIGQTGRHCVQREARVQGIVQHLKASPFGLCDSLEQLNAR